MNKKYYPSAFILYLNYFIHGIGCSVLGQVAVKETLVKQWGASDIGLVTCLLYTSSNKNQSFCKIQVRQ